MIDQNIDIICLAETKLDSSFPKSNFLISGYSTPYRIDINSKSGGLLVYIKDNIPSKLLNDITIPIGLQIIPFEINLRKSKWLIISIYRPPSTNVEFFIDNLNRIVDFYSSNYDNVLILGDFNMDTSNKLLIPFLESQQLYSLNKNPTCFKSVNGNCIDLLLTNKNRSFKHTNVFETGMSDHHLMIYTMFRTTFDKKTPNIIKYKSYRKFDKNTFIKDLHGNLSNISEYNPF